IHDQKRNKQDGTRRRIAVTNRSDQAKALRERIESSPFPCIVMGDFNDTLMSYRVNAIGQGMHNAFREQGFGWGVTHRAMIPIFQIDYIFSSKHFTVANYGMLKEKLSDHYPVWADLRI